MRWADDGFRGKDGVWGGDLVDTATPFAGRDKVQHLAGMAVLFLLLVRWAGLARWQAFLVTVAVGVLWEGVEMLRKHLGRWGFAVDDPSWRDVVAGAVGAAIAWAVL